jgi:hypothetical protein
LVGRLLLSPRAASEATIRLHRVATFPLLTFPRYGVVPARKIAPAATGKPCPARCLFLHRSDRLRFPLVKGSKRKEAVGAVGLGWVDNPHCPTAAAVVPDASSAKTYGAVAVSEKGIGLNQHDDSGTIWAGGIWGLIPLSVATERRVTSVEPAENTARPYRLQRTRFPAAGTHEIAV